MKGIYVKKYRQLAAILALALTTGVGGASICSAQDIADQPLSVNLDGAIPAPPEEQSALGAPPQGPGRPPAPGQEQQDASKLTAQLISDHEAGTYDNQNLTASSADENAFLARNGATVTLTNSTLCKTGDSSDVDASNFSGQNAVFLSSNSIATLSNLKLDSNANGANAIFSTGEKSVVNVNHVVIHTKNNSSRGLDATYGGTIHAKDVEITTEGAHCGALATDRGEGNVIVENAKIVTSGEGSPCIYSTGNIQLTNGTGEAMGSEIAVVEGKNSITLNNAHLTGHIKHGIMLYQSFSGDAGVGEAKFTAKNSILTNKSDGPMFYITNTTATANLDSTQLIHDGDVLIQAASDRWGNEGRNGGSFTLNATHQELKGKILANTISQVTLNLQSGSHWIGSFNEDYTADAAVLNLAKDAVWEVTGNSYLTTISDADMTFSNINSNGHKIYYDKKANPNLGGKTYKLPGGGKLIAK
ncbi:hypothetical protein SAMN05216584_1131 [Selenomonas sp. WCT3]|uniref:hypothetical protein n=1 Tax=Selenomonas sp. WCT3 TaxID=3158785 RepID=UPI0008900564|nr:hypothetical protein SAMN05216584_1131 [Selenomonas ruminantium]